MNTFTKEKGIVWNLNKTDVHVGSIVDYILQDLNVSPLHFCTVVEHSLVTHNENGYYVFSDKEIYVPVSYVRDKVSLPVLLFTLLFGNSSYACFVWSKLDYFKQSFVQNKLFHDALCIVGDWFYGMYMNCPAMDDAILVGRCDLKMMVSELAYRLRLASGFSTSENMRRVTYFLEQPWIIEPAFLKTFISISVRSSIHYKGIGIEKTDKDDKYYILKNDVRHYVDVKGHFIVRDQTFPQADDFILEQVQRLLVQIQRGEKDKESTHQLDFGLVCCPRDKLVFLAVLLFSSDYNIFNELVFKKDSFLRDPGFVENNCEEHRLKNDKMICQKKLLSDFPEPLQVIIQFLVRPYEPTFELPGHFDHINSI